MVKVKLAQNTSFSAPLPLSLHLLMDNWDATYGTRSAVVGIDNWKSNGALLSTFSNSVDSSLRYFYRFLIFKIYRFDIFIDLWFSKFIASIFLSVFDFQNSLLQYFYRSLIFKIYCFNTFSGLCFSKFIPLISSTVFDFQNVSIWWI